MSAGVYVALLRGINVGGANKLAMGDLKAIFEGAGCSRVQTIIQSGNVVFAAPAALLGDLAGIASRPTSSAALASRRQSF